MVGRIKSLIVGSGNVCKNPKCFLKVLGTSKEGGH